MKNRTKLPNIYIGVVTAVLYLPIVLVIIYSFNESKISSVWGGFSLKWYETLFRDAAMFEALGENNINISMISTSEIKISVLIDQDQGKKAVNAIHDAFSL